MTSLWDFFTGRIIKTKHPHDKAAGFMRWLDSRHGENCREMSITHMTFISFRTLGLWIQGRELNQRNIGERLTELNQFLSSVWPKLCKRTSSQLSKVVYGHRAPSAMAWLMEDQDNNNIWWSLLGGDMYPDLGPASYSSNFIPDCETPYSSNMSMCEYMRVNGCATYTY